MVIDELLAKTCSALRSRMYVARQKKHLDVRVSREELNELLKFIEDTKRKEIDYWPYQYNPLTPEEIWKEIKKAKYFQARLNYGDLKPLMDKFLRLRHA